MEDKNVVKSMLNNIYEMEQAMIPLLENQAKDAKSYPHLGKYIKKLLKESKDQASRAQQYLNMIEGGIVNSINTNLESLVNTTSFTKLAKN